MTNQEMNSPQRYH